MIPLKVWVSRVSEVSRRIRMTRIASTPTRMYPISEWTSFS